MKAAVRYFSRGGNIKALAEAFARGAGVKALSVDDPNAALTEPVDVLFIGGALYAYRLDDRLSDYIRDIPEGLVGRAVCFGSSYLTRRPVYLIQELLKGRGITIVPQAVYARNKPKQSLIDACEYFAAREIERDASLDGLSPYERFRAMRIATGDVSLEDAENELDELEEEDEATENDLSVASDDAPALGQDVAPRDDDDDDALSEESFTTMAAPLLINVDGLNAAFKDQVVEIVEAIPGIGFKRADIPGTPATSLVFACDGANDIDDMVPLIKGTLKKSELGNIMLFRVAPHGEVMWVPKKK